MWLSDIGCTNVDEAVWTSHEEADPSIKVIKKIKKCGKEIQDWNQKHFGNVKRELEKKKNIEGGRGRTYENRSEFPG